MQNFGKRRSVHQKICAQNAGTNILKVLTTIHKSLHTPSAPTYMRELFPVYKPHKTLRSSSDKWKLVAKKSSNKYGARAIQTLRAQLWYELPLELRELEEHGAFRKNQNKLLLFKVWTCPMNLKVQCTDSKCRSFI